MFELKGIIPPMVTPFDANGDIVYADFESNLDRYLEVGVTGYLVLGSNGEAVYLDHDEKLRRIEAADSITALESGPSVASIGIWSDLQGSIRSPRGGCSE